MAVTIGHHVRVDADGRVVDEYSAVEFADIDLSHTPGCNHANGSLDVDRDAEILGEVIERAEGNDTERNAGPGEHAGDGAYRSIAAPNGNPVDTVVPRTQNRRARGFRHSDAIHHD